MKATELMIYDWVYIREYPMRQEAKQMMEDYFFRSLCEFEPIPLTEELLEKNGFEKYREGVYRLITETDAIIIEPMKIESRLGNKWYWFHNKDREMKVVKPRIAYPFVYVNELQHALRLCGLWDLANDFKIK